MATKAVTKSAALPKEIRAEIESNINERLQEMNGQGQINLPANYSLTNAVQSAWLMINAIKKVNVFEKCTKGSIANAILDMVVQGLNPAKKQCYFIPYDDQLTLVRSYMGTVAVAKRVIPNFKDITAQVVHEGEEFTFETNGGSQFVTVHKQTLDSMNKPIIGVYAVMLDNDGEVMDSMVMTMESIKQSWKQSKANPIDQHGNIKAETTHGKFTEEMAKRTIINRLLKRHINASDDGSLVFESINRQEMAQTEAQAVEDINESANTVDIDDVGADEVVEAEYTNVEAAEESGPEF